MPSVVKKTPLLKHNHTRQLTLTARLVERLERRRPTRAEAHATTSKQQLGNEGEPPLGSVVISTRNA